MTKLESLIKDLKNANNEKLANKVYHKALRFPREINALLKNLT